MRGRLTSSDGHAVVIGKDDVNRLVSYLGTDAVHDLKGSLTLPVGNDIGKDVDVGEGVEHLMQSLFALLRGGAASKPFYLNDIAALGQEISDVTGSLSPHIHVVTSDESCVFLAVDFAVYQHHGDVCIVGFLNDRTQGFPLVRCHHNGIDPTLDETLDVGYLLLSVVGGGVNFHIEVGVKEGFTTHLLIHLVTPLVHGALRHGNNLLPFASAGKE